MSKSACAFCGICRVLENLWGEEGGDRLRRRGEGERSIGERDRVILGRICLREGLEGWEEESCVRETGRGGRSGSGLGLV